MDQVTTAKIFWNESPGDPCTHGWCSGRMILPVDSNAAALSIQTSCDVCGKIREHRGKRRMENHYRLCHDCALRKKNQGAIEVRCTGYHLYGQTRFSRRCAREKTLQKAKFLHYLSANENEGTFSYCRPCSSARSAIRTRERVVKKHLEHARDVYKKTAVGSKKFEQIAGLKVDLAIPKIRTFSELSRLYKICRQFSFMDPQNKESIQYPGGIRMRFPGNTKPQEFRGTSRVIGQLVRRAIEVASRRSRATARLVALFCLSPVDSTRDRGHCRLQETAAKICKC